MTIYELLSAVKEQNLPLQTLEKYHDSMTHLFSSMQMEMADLEKEEALFIFERLHRTEKMTNIEAERSWKVTERGQRMIEVKNALRALSKELSGLKHKLFNTL
jgi:DNA integrity scanning protein DisA with diadenylate cyclase activity